MEALFDLVPLSRPPVQQRILVRLVRSFQTDRADFDLLFSTFFTFVSQFLLPSDLFLFLNHPH